MINVKRLNFEDNILGDLVNYHNVPIVKRIDCDNDNPFNILNKKIENSPVFYISKFHKRKCSHSSSKTKKNLIKKLVYEDYLKIIAFKDSGKPKTKNSTNKNNNFINNTEKINVNNVDVNNCNKDSFNNTVKRFYLKNFDTTGYDFNNEDTIQNNKNNNILNGTYSIPVADSNINNLFLKKKTTNRNFRLFDKDVVIKKVMSNFMKFIKLVLENFLIEKGLKNKFELRQKIFEEIFANVEKCKEFLNKKIILDFLIKKNDIKTKIWKNKKSEITNFFDLKIIDIYKINFLDSNFMQNYVFPKIKKDHDQSYYLHFVQFLHKIY